MCATKNRQESNVDKFKKEVIRYLNVHRQMALQDIIEIGKAVSPELTLKELDAILTDYVEKLKLWSYCPVSGIFYLGDPPKDNVSVPRYQMDLLIARVSSLEEKTNSKPTSDK